ncbi:DUF4157 domain-containing protein, partial [Gemmatimonadota bacterium]
MGVIDKLKKFGACIGGGMVWFAANDAVTYRNLDKPKKKLTRWTKDRLRNIFPSVTLSDVRYKTDCSLPSNWFSGSGASAMTMGQHIYFDKSGVINNRSGFDLLIHEMVHVEQWQKMREDHWNDTDTHWEYGCEYGEGYWNAGFDYYSNPMEAEAYDFQRRLALTLDIQFYRNKYAQHLRRKKDFATYNHWLAFGIKEGWQGSIIFDPTYYLSMRPAIQRLFGKNAYAAATSIWLRDGIKLGKPTTRAFDPVWYVNHHKDLRDTIGGDYEASLMHWADQGIKDGRRGNRIIDLWFYLNHNKDLRKVFRSKMKYIHALEHWFIYGIAEGRRTSPAFDVKYYLQSYKDLRKAFGPQGYSAAMDHWVNYGLNEGRKSSEDF